MIHQAEGFFELLHLLLIKHGEGTAGRSLSGFFGFFLNSRRIDREARGAEEKDDGLRQSFGVLGDVRRSGGLSDM